MPEEDEVEVGVGICEKREAIIELVNSIENEGKLEYLLGYILLMQSRWK